MQAHSSIAPFWAALTVWSVVNAVNILQTAGFLSRVYTGETVVNHILGYFIMILAVPSIIALIAFVRTGAGWIHWAGPAVFLVFVIFMVFVDYLLPVEFRSPVRYDILVPYLLLFFGSILLMGLPMFRLNPMLWLLTVSTSVLLLGSMGFSMHKGMG